jgi:alpha-ketoglutarate-dependent taurine dioxygenase
MLTCRPLSDTVGAEVVGLDSDSVQDDRVAADLLAALEQYGVLVLRDLNLAPEHQVVFGERLGEVDFEPGHHPVPGIYRVTRDKSKNSSADYLKATLDWHMDGCMPLHGEPPQKATILTAVAVAASGGETEFASTYAAYESLSEGEKQRFSQLRVLHSMEASQRFANPSPTAEQLERWRARTTSTHPLVWNRRTGRKSLVIGTHADHIVEMNFDEGRALLEELIERTTAPERVYRHEWSVGDTVIWDNTGVVHRAAPYDPESPRELLRTTVFGDEPIR